VDAPGAEPSAFAERGYRDQCAWFVSLVGCLMGRLKYRRQDMALDQR
jgi:hypothetical protein